MLTTINSHYWKDLSNNGKIEEKQHFQRLYFCLEHKKRACMRLFLGKYFQYFANQCLLNDQSLIIRYSIELYSQIVHAWLKMSSIQFKLVFVLN